MAATPGTKEDNKTMVGDSSCPGAAEEVMSMEIDKTARPMRAGRRDVGDEVLAFVHGRGDWQSQCIRDALSEREISSVEDALIPKERCVKPSRGCRARAEGAKSIRA